MMAALLPFVAAPTAGATSLLPPIGDATVLTHGPLEQAMPGNLQGRLCPQSKPCTTVPYDPLVVLYVPGVPVINLETNIAELNDYIESPTIPGQKIVFAYSGGARDTLGWMQEHANDPKAPPSKDLSFVLIGNPTRKYGGIDSVLGGPVMDPVTAPYEVLDVAQQYDLISDFPQNPFNMLAVANAVAGFVYLHLDYANVNVDDPNNYVWTEGNVTYVYVPTENLPLLEPLRRDGMGWLADALNAPLKAMVEQGYDRSWLPAEPQGGTPEVTSAAMTFSKLGTVKATSRSLGTKIEDVNPDTAGDAKPDTAVDAKVDATKVDAIKVDATEVDDSKTGETTTEPVSGGTVAADPAPSTTTPSTATPSTTPGATQSGGGKHRLPRTPLRDKLFGTTTKVPAATDDVAATATSTTTKSVTKITTKAVNRSTATSTPKGSEKAPDKSGE